MKIKNQKGIAGIDIIIALVSLGIFIVIITTLVINYNSQAKQLELKAIAIEYAVAEIEKIKGTGYIDYEDENSNGVFDEGEPQGYDNLGIDQIDNLGEENKEILLNGKSTGFYLTIMIEDYKHRKESAQPNIVKEITVKISYMFQGEEQSQSITTLITKND